MVGWFTRILTGGSDRTVKRLLPTVEKINALEPGFERLSDEELRAKTAEFRARLGVAVDSAAPPADGKIDGRADGAPHETLDDILPEAFAAVREASKRALNMRHFDVQLIGGMVLHQGKIAEMKTGEGKTLVASLPLYLNSLLGRGVHLVTPNDYLARVGAGWMGPVYHRLGVTVAARWGDNAGLYDPEYVDATPHGDERLMHFRPVSIREGYLADITYGTNHDFGFDYLRDNCMAYDLSQVVQRERYFAIVDEVDNILIDEARTPLIISGQADEPPQTYYQFAQIVSQLEAERDYSVDLKLRAVTLTDEGIERVEKLAGVANIYDEQNYHLVHYLEQALSAYALFRRDRDYVLMKDGRVLNQGERIQDAEVVIVDEFTGRLMTGRRYSEGLHQAIEAKEGVQLRRENLTVATITLQNYFRLYQKLAGMTGTAATEAEEFRKIYNLEVVQIPTNRPMVRLDEPDLIYKTAQSKLEAIVDEIEEMHEVGRPVLVGTTSVEKSERLSEILDRRGITHEVLNAKVHEREALIVAQAGRKKAVTIATNMAGRGTDILLGGDPPDPQEAAEIRELGGLHVVGTERHESRRIDNQLRGRAGRQGDPGSSRFYLSLEDDLMRRFGSERIAGLMDRLGLEDDQPIEHSLVSKSIETAQEKVEGYNFDLRKHTVEYDDVMNRQREVIYGERRNILVSEDLKEPVLTMVRGRLSTIVAEHTESPRPDEWDLEALFNAVQSMLGPELQHTAEELVGENQETLVEVMSGWARELYEAKEQTYSPQLLNMAARATLLRIIDELWAEHLTSIDDMKAGIGLRAYGQRDPLTEYKAEAYRMFQNLLADIQGNMANVMFRIQFVPGPAQTAEGATTVAGDGAGLAPNGVLADEPPSATSVDGANGTAGQAADAKRPATANPALERRIKAIAQPPAFLRNAVTNQPVEREVSGGRKPAIENGRPMTRSERNRQEELAKRQRKRELKRSKGK